MEIGPPFSFAGDMAATAAKASGTTLGRPQPYASGLNWLFRRTADTLGNPTISSTPLKGILTGVGNKATPALAVTGVFTFSYNATIAVECGCGVLK